MDAWVDPWVDPWVTAEGTVTELPTKLLGVSPFLVRIQLVPVDKESESESKKSMVNSF